nr:immunoglobulin heavy chain junction region [Mus musculus]MBK4188942.1 immunoglobulin heavy chain junction region [Mus musculus]
CARGDYDYGSSYVSYWYFAVW